MDDSIDSRRPHTPIILVAYITANISRFNALGSQKQPDNFDEIFQTKAELNWQNVLRRNVDQNINNNSPSNNLHNYT